MRCAQLFTAILASFFIAIAIYPGALYAQSVSDAKASQVLAAKLASQRPIEARQSYWLEELTWMEVRDLVDSGHTTVIIPTGGVEENGPFLSTGKHNVILEAACPAIASQLGNALCAPIVKFVPEGDIDPPTRAMRFPGTISLSDSTYEALLTDIASSLRHSGFTDIVMIGDSGGNQRGMAAVAEKLNQRWGASPTRFHFVKEFYSPGWEATENYTREVLGVDETRKDGHHDDIWVTAMMMVTDPAQVRFEERVAADLASINGVEITPLEDTVALGQQMIAFRAELTSEAIRAAIEASR
ncbi:creatininase family protein [Congregibacter brevis]|uniref:Creatininase family protein n=1 Tax=Congregibacter brevis TaxID=3081201 RepID=A0ABZ0I9B1_9GAMM|nr:creatininase family protein [Congregibacter sp. IMCC45268]